MAALTADCVSRSASAAVAAQVPPKRYGIRIVDAPFIDRCHRAGISVHAWTINASAEMERLLDVGVDGIMTDVPSELAALLRRRGVAFGSGS